MTVFSSTNNSTIETFMTSVSKRSDYYRLVTQKALELSGCSVNLIENSPMLDRYKVAEMLSTEEIYVLCDDDIIPSSKHAIKNMVECLRSHPEFGIMGLSWKKGISCGEMGEWCKGEYDKEVLVFDHVGGIMAIRKGCIPESTWNEKCDYQNGLGDDKVVCRSVLKNGYKTGLYTQDWFTHLGHYQSTCWL